MEAFVVVFSRLSNVDSEQDETTSEKTPVCLPFPFVFFVHNFCMHARAQKRTHTEGRIQNLKSFLVAIFTEVSF